MNHYNINHEMLLNSMTIMTPKFTAHPILAEITFINEKSTLLTTIDGTQHENKRHFFQPNVQYEILFNGTMQFVIPDGLTREKRERFYKCITSEKLSDNTVTELIVSFTKEDVIYWCNNSRFVNVETQIVNTNEYINHIYDYNDIRNEGRTWEEKYKALKGDSLWYAEVFSHPDDTVPNFTITTDDGTTETVDFNPEEWEHMKLAYEFFNDETILHDGTGEQRQAQGHLKSSGKYAPLATSTPRMLTTCSSERCSCSATTMSAATPPRCASHADTPAT